MSVLNSNCLIPGNVFIIVIGASGSGKSTLVVDLLTDNLEYFDAKFDSVVVVCEGDDNQPAYKKLRKFWQHRLTIVDKYDHDLLESGSLFPENKPVAVVVDDCLYNLGKSNWLPQAAIKLRSKKQISVFFLTQVAYSTEVPQLRICTRNCTGMLYLPQIRDTNSVRLMASQVFGKSNVEKFMLMYKKAMKDYGHVYLSTTTFLPDERLRLIAGLGSGQVPAIYEL